MIWMHLKELLLCSWLGHRWGQRLTPEMARVNRLAGGRESLWCGRCGALGWRDDDGAIEVG